MRLILASLLLLAGCSKGSDVMEELPNSSLAGAPRENMSESRMDAPLARPVTIGEDGPRLDACGSMGQVNRVGIHGLVLRAAPFSDAKDMGRLGDGQRAYVCTRSIDQKWLGVVVVPPAPDVGATPLDCGLSDPVDRKQPYDGPCQSGWVLSAYVRLVAG